MEQILFITSLIVLIGLQLGVPKKKIEKQLADNALLGCPLTESAILKILYGKTYIIGVLYVLFCVLYLSIKFHWYYILIYLVAAVPLSKLCSFIIELLFIPNNYKFNDPIYGTLKIRRILGVIIIIIASLIGILALFI